MLIIYNIINMQRYSRSYGKSSHSYSGTNKGYANKSKPTKSAKTSSSTKPTYVYSLNLKGGKKYVGLSKNPERRIAQHFSGNGAKFTQKNKPISVNHVQKCKNMSNAKQAETIVYKKMRDYHGKDKVRGAGHTKSY
jgi:predicted GIY-YIG superfamily endonuclease